MIAWLSRASIDGEKARIITLLIELNNEICNKLCTNRGYSLLPPTTPLVKQKDIENDPWLFFHLCLAGARSSPWMSVTWSFVTSVRWTFRYIFSPSQHKTAKMTPASKFFIGEVGEKTKFKSICLNSHVVMISNEQSIYIFSYIDDGSKKNRQ